MNHRIQKDFIHRSSDTHLFVIPTFKQATLQLFAKPQRGLAKNITNIINAPNTTRMLDLYTVQ